MANPTNPTVVNGTATFATAGNILNITNSQNAIINWGSFSIGINELTRFIQPSALSAVLNRVIGQDPSAILGALQSNGRVFLINPNGILFGSGAQIDVAGLVASTLNLSNEDFLNNRMRFTDGAGAGSVVNQGSITGGSVYLVGKAVANEGLITSPNGEVVLAAGNSVELVNPGTPNLRVEIVAPDNEAKNLGSIASEAGRIGIYAGLINNSGTLNASSAVAEGGRIMLKATKNTTLAASSILDASGAGGGRIDVLADDTVRVDGRLDASAPVSGNGGFIETSGKNRVKLGETAVITTNAPSGKTGTWLIDPTDFVIASDGSGDAYGSEIITALGSTNVVISSADGTSGVNGDILVNDLISWTSANSLTLTAYRNVEVNNTIQNRGTGGINLYAGWDGTSPAATPTLVGGRGDININAPVIAGDSTNLNPVGGAGTVINLAAGGTVNINDVVSATGANNLLGSGDQAAVNVSGTAIVVSNEVYATAGDGAEGGAGGKATIILNAGTGGITIAGGGLTASGGRGGNGDSFVANAGAGGDALITLASGGNVDILGGYVKAFGGNGAPGYYSGGDGGAGGKATINLSVAGDLNVIGNATNGSGSIFARAGFGGNGSSGRGGRGGDALIQTTGGGITGNLLIEATPGYGGYIEARGGSGGGGAIQGGDGGKATVALAVGNDMSIGTGASDGGITARGGNAGWTDSVPAVGGDAKVQLTAGRDIIVSRYLSAYGGQGGAGYFSGAGKGGDATVELTAARHITVDGTGLVTASGGEGGDYSSGMGGRGGDAKVKFTTTSGNINVNSGGLVVARGGGCNSTGSSACSGYYFGGGGGPGGNATIELASGAAMTIEGELAAYGGRADFSWYGDGGNGGDAAIKLTSAGGMTVSDTQVLALGGHGQGGGGSESIGNGGRGGDATVEITSGGDLAVSSALVLARGGVGGNGGSSGGDGGRGGDAMVKLTAGGALNVTSASTIVGQGGWGGWAGSGFGGRGGDATVELKTLSGNMSVTDSTIDSDNYSSYTSYVDDPYLCCGPAGAGGGGYLGGGRGGNAVTKLTSAGSMTVTSSGIYADGGEGSWNSTNTVTGSGTLNLTAAGPISIASSELGAWGGSAYGYGTTGADASVTIRSTGSTVSIADSSAMVYGGDTYYSSPELANGGSATLAINSAGATTVSSSGLYAYGGEGAEGGAGGNATASITAGGRISMVSNSYISGYAGSANNGFISGTGGNAAVGLNASGGNIQIDGSEGYASGGNGATGGSAVVALLSAGDIALSNYSGILNAYPGYGDSAAAYGGSAFIVGAAGNVSFVNVSASSPGSFGIAGSNVLLDNSNLSASGSMVVGALGNLDVLNGSNLTGYGNAVIGATGNVTVDNSMILGDPDVVMSVGGTVNQNNGGTIQAGAPTTIHLNFPVLTEGGYFVNGIEGVVFDPLTGTGFMAGGSPAILGTNLLVTYFNPVLTVPTDNLIVAMGESTKPPDPEKNKDIFNETEDEKKKDAPVCR